MQTENLASKEWIIRALTSGRFAEKLEAQRLLEDKGATFDRAATRNEIIRLLENEFDPKHDGSDDGSDRSGNRCWLLSSLGHLPPDNGQPKRILTRHTNQSNEPNHWARYWALEALLRHNPSDLKEHCQLIADNDQALLPKMLACAVLARDGEAAQRRKIQEIIESTSTDEKTLAEKWNILRALRFVYIASVVKPLCQIVANPQNDDITYDAIVTLGNVPSQTPQAEKASVALSGFITEYRRYQFWDAMRIRAIGSLGSLKIESSAALLLEELTDLNPAIAKESALALEAILGPSTTVSRVLEALAKRGDREIGRYARGLREMRDQKAVAEELGIAILSHSGSTPANAQRLLSEIGGVSAFDKLRSLTKSTERYLAAMDEADKNLRKLFDETIEEARMGFKMVIGMDVAVFFIGALLIGLSAFLALKEPSPSATWSTWIAGGGGVLAVVYGRFIAKPRAQVEASVQYLSGLKAIFLGYLRQLRQTDQSYTRRVLEDERLTAEETKKFNTLVEEIMDKSVERLMAKPTRLPSDQ